MEGLSDKFVNLNKLCMNNVGIRSLDGLPALPSLTVLELSDNRISSGLEKLTVLKKLRKLNLSGNKIKELEGLRPLVSLRRGVSGLFLIWYQQRFLIVQSQLKNLKVLDLYNCEVTKLDNYREKVFDMIPSLQYLDNLDA